MIRRRAALAALTGLLAATLAVAPAHSQAPATGKAELQWFGQSAFKLTTPGGKVLMLDPWITNNPKTPEALRSVDGLGKVDLIVVSHGHFDHFQDAPEIAKKNKAPVVGPAGLGQTVQVLGVLPPELSIRMNKSGTIEPLPGIRITQVHADHSSEMVLKDPVTGRDGSYPGGEAVGHIIELENAFKIWHMGDTGLFSDMQLIAEYYKPDLVLMPIGGWFVMSPRDAAYALTHWIKPKRMVPMHYGTTVFLKGTPAELKAALGTAPIEVIEMQPGEKRLF